ncbi:DnaJ domain-containing protein [Candidatus Daviesbacteria bacterium]|nr:DnaJ domain-containing protein [Candidatus Daviesbacteria bacterium]
MLKKLNPKIVKRLLPFFLIFALGLGIGFYLPDYHLNSPSQFEEKNTPKAFLGEVYEKIKENYWDNISDIQLLDQFKLATEQVTTNPQLPYSNKDQMISAVLSATSGEDQKDKVISIVSTVLAHLNPNGRSGLFTQKQEVALKNTVENVDPNKDLYKDLDLSKGASESAITDAYQKKSEELAQDKSPQAQEKLKQLSYAKDVLTQKDTKQRYDSKGIEPTISTKTITPQIVYLQFKKFSPTSLEEFVQALDTFKDNNNIQALVFDLRGNIGGAIDATAYFLGFFLGKNQYAFDFYQKGQYLPFKTPTDKHPAVNKFKQIIVLIDNQTQSSAEMLVASFKKYHLGVVVGETTKGWGTVERVFPLENQLNPEEKYSMFLVHSVTLREDNQPIEGRGVEPDINIKNSKWSEELFSYFKDQQLVNSVKIIL